jgi:hypothetical protein
MIYVCLSRAHWIDTKIWLDGKEKYDKPADQSL